MSTTNFRTAFPMSPDALTAVIRSRPARAEAKTLISESVVPMRTCYETMIRLVGPIDAVLDYASYLFSAEDAAPTHAAPPLTVEEAHISDGGRGLSVVLARGSFALR